MEALSGEPDFTVSGAAEQQSMGRKTLHGMDGAEYRGPASELAGHPWEMPRVWGSNLLQGLPGLESLGYSKNQRHSTL